MTTQTPTQETSDIPTKSSGQKSYWARLTPAQRSAEVKRRMAKRHQSTKSIKPTRSTKHEQPIPDTIQSDRDSVMAELGTRIAVLENELTMSRNFLSILKKMKIS